MLTTDLVTKVSSTIKKSRIIAEQENILLRKPWGQIRVFILQEACPGAGSECLNPSTFAMCSCAPGEAGQAGQSQSQSSHISSSRHHLRPCGCQRLWNLDLSVCLLSARQHALWCEPQLPLFSFLIFHLLKSFKSFIFIYVSIFNH